MMTETPLIAWPVLLPLVGGLLAFVMPRGAKWIGLAVSGGIGAGVVSLAGETIRANGLRYAVGGWGAPLGIELRADGLSLWMLALTALIGFAISIYAAGYFAGPVAGEDGEKQRHQREYFWPLWMFLWSALNALFLSADIFNLYVTLEMIGFSAACLVALAGKPAALNAALRYLLVGLLGSLCFLFGVALVYSAHGTVDLATLSRITERSPGTLVAMGLMTIGLLMKCALFPLHFWLPPAHANAPAPVSALLSAVVVKGAFYILARLWFEGMHSVVTPGFGQCLGLLGSGAIFWGSWQALRQSRLKLLVAYSTVAQLGYLFLLFPLATDAAQGFGGWSGAWILVAAHACAKAAMFLAAGNILRAAGHDRIRDLDGITHALPISVFAFALAGVSLIGLPPSGGFIGKWLLLGAALAQGQWWWIVVILAGGLAAAGYVFRVLSHAFTRDHENEAAGLKPVPALLEWTGFALALGAVLLGFAAGVPAGWLRLGAPVDGALLPGGAGP
jgi:multicomponent Na+:H+ antiporter subunit D